MRIKLAVVLMLGAATASCAVAQEKGDVFFRTGGAVGAGIGEKISRTPVLGAPYSAMITNESSQLLADGNRITQSSSGTMARDSQGRTRQDAPLPAIGNMAAANAPHFVFINDPVGEKTYTLNLTEKTAQSFAMPRTGSGTGVGVGTGGSVEVNTLFLKLKQEAEASASGQTAEIATQKKLDHDGQGQGGDLGGSHGGEHGRFRYADNGGRARHGDTHDEDDSGGTNWK